MNRIRFYLQDHRGRNWNGRKWSRGKPKKYRSLWDVVDIRRKVDRSANIFST